MTGRENLSFPNLANLTHHIDFQGVLRFIELYASFVKLILPKTTNKKARTHHKRFFVRDVSDIFCFLEGRITPAQSNQS
jgi:hypothetical protein